MSNLDLSVLMSFQLRDVFKLWRNKGSHFTTVAFTEIKSVNKPATITLEYGVKDIEERRQKDMGVWLT